MTTDIDKAARLTERNPTEAQKASGNYAKGKVRLHGLEIAIESPKGGERSGVDKGGKKWSVKMPAHYGYVKGTEGKDGDHIDVYVGPKADAHNVYVVDQVDAKSGAFDEHKVMLGYASKANALADYKLAFSDGKGADRIGSVTELSIDEFKSWLRNKSNTKQPMARRSYATGGHVTNDPTNYARWLMQRYYGGRVKGYETGGAPEFPEQGEAAGDMSSPRWLDTRLPGTKDKSIRDFLSMMREQVAYDPSFAASMTGAPGMMRGYDKVSDPEAGNLRKIEGGAEMAMNALPFTRLMGPAGKAAETLTATIPRSVATYGTLGVAADAENTFPAIADLASKAGFSQAKASEAQAAGLPAKPEDEGLAWERAQAKGNPEKPAITLPPLPEMPKKYEGEPRKKTEVQTIQRDLIKGGYLPPKKPDGRPSDDGDDGGGTREAQFRRDMDDYDKAIARYERLKSLQNQGIEAETKKTGAETAAADAEAEKTRKAANKTFQDDPANATSGWRSAARAAAPYVGLGVGAVLGGKWGSRATRLQGEAEEAAANVAKNLWRGYAKKPFGERVGVANRAYTEGGSEPPFVFASKDPFWKVNQGTPRVWPLPPKKPLEATDLYDPGWRAGPQLSNLSYAGLLAGVDQAGAGYLIDNAEKEVASARAAYELNSNATTKARLESAEDAVAGYYGLLRAGQMGAATKVASGGYGLYKLPRIPIDTSKAADARTNLSQEITKKTAAASAKAKKARGQKPPKPPGGGGPGGVVPLLPLSLLPSQTSLDPQEGSPELASAETSLITPETEHKNGGKVDKHHSNYQPRRIGKFAGGPVYPKYKNGGSTSQRRVDIGYADGGIIRKLLGKLMGAGSKAQAPAAALEKESVPQITRDFYAAPTHQGKEGWSGVNRALDLEEKGVLDPARTKSFWDAQSDFETAKSSAGRTLHASGGGIGRDSAHPLVDNSMNRAPDMDEVHPFSPSKLTRFLKDVEAERELNADPAAMDEPLTDNRAMLRKNPPSFDQGGYVSPLDYGNDAQHPTSSNRRPEDVRDPQAPRRPLPMFPTLPFSSAYFDPAAWRMAGENIGPRVKDATIDALPWAMMMLRQRRGEMNKMKEAEAHLRWDDAYFNNKNPNAVLDPGVSGGGRYDPRSSYSRADVDSSLGLAVRPGVRNAEWNPLVKPTPSSYDVVPPRPANSNSLVPDGWSAISKAYGGGVGLENAYAGYEEGGVPEGPNNEGLIQTGLVHGTTGGREDARPVSVRSGAFVIPADVVAALGSGNTMAGAAVLDKSFKKRPSTGGMNMATGQDVPIKISDGEYLLEPEQVYEIGNGDMDRGHAILDKFVLAVREKNINDLSRLPPPAKS